MRQAGRYLPEYRATRAKAGGFMDLCRNADLACEVTLQPLERFDLDAAILFSDILTIPDAMGLDLEFQAGEGPVFHKPLRTEADVAALPKLVVERDLDYVMNAVRTIRGALGGRVPLIGFSGSPWTLATYMIEGAGSKEYPFAKGMLYGQPDVMHALLDQLADTVADYLNAQIRAGAQAVQIFDTWGGALPFAQYNEFSLRSMKRVVDQLIREHDGRKVPVIMFTKGGGAWLEAMADAAPMRWGWIGGVIWVTRASALAIELRCKATWTPGPCSAATKRSVPRPSEPWINSVPTRAMCLIWAMDQPICQCGSSQNLGRHRARTLGQTARWAVMPLSGR